MGYVYILQNDSMPGLLKIGKTARNSRERAKELSKSTGVPTPFRVVFDLSSDRYEILEREVHSKLARYRNSLCLHCVQKQRNHRILPEKLG